ncbi:hypothetical protein C3F09_07825 [candidate division GN15 bacterium]|uniref:T9SS type A sorting domain-containing protein n=1 Tax=candidate division GN15 bacterium TaxID=2072418 RepID=A0A855X660_9BACT|nr:MAG: hypothetical protein C3F09_07825 [candidate division GN15 bacterium]
MNKKLILVSLILLLAVPLFAAPRLGSRGPKPVATDLDNSSFIDANNIFMFVTNQGSFGRDLNGVFGYDYGTFFPYNGIQYILDGSQIASPLYASGLWIGGIDSATTELRVKVAEYNSEYWQGPWETAPVFQDNANIHVYHLYADSLASNPNTDYNNWIYAARQGAPFDGDSATPAMIGDQMCWAVYHDRDDTLKFNNAGNTGPIGIEIRQTTFAFKREGPLNNIIFIKFQAHNRGGRTIQNCYFSLWADPDLGGSGDDLVGCDSTLGLGFIYNATNSDADYGSTPPSLGYDFFQGPLVYTGDLADTGRAWDAAWPGYTNLGMVSFNKYINGTDPEDAGQTYNYMQGLNADGSVYTYNGLPTKYFVAGDPVGNVGDVDFSPADRRFMQSTGPITFRPNDSVEILAAIIVGDGTNRKSSISVMKYYDVFAQKAYDNHFQIANPPVAPIVSASTTNGTITLRWTDTSEVDHGDYPFEGYTIYQGVSPSGPWTVVDNFAVLNATVKDEVIDPNSGQTETRVVKLANDHTMQRYITLREDYITGNPLYNTTRYYYKVGAYSYDPVKLPKILESVTGLSVVPQWPNAGEQLTWALTDTIAVNHAAGRSDGTVTPYVVEPRLLNGHVYKVVFREDPVLGFLWSLVDSTADTTLILDNANQSDDGDYPILDGFHLRVAGPPLQGRSATYRSASPANISPVVHVADTAYEGGRWFTGPGPAYGELQNGMVYLEPRFKGTTLLPSEYPIVEMRWRPMESFTDLTGDGYFTPGEPYVVDDTDLTQKAFMYQNYAPPANYLGFYRVPFTAWDVTDPANPRQLNVVVRDRDQNHQWEYWYEATNDDTLYLPNGGDLSRNYIWILNTTYDPTGTYYGDGTGGTIAATDGPGGAMIDAAWALYMLDRGVVAEGNRWGMLAEEFTYRLVPYFINLPDDTFRFVATSPVKTQTEKDLEAINVVPNPYYLIGPYDPAPTNRNIYFQHLPDSCTISIYNLAGELVKKITRSDATSSITSWDVMTENNLPVASGIYIWVVEAPGFGQRIGKMAVFMEAEVIKKY